MTEKKTKKEVEQELEKAKTDLSGLTEAYNQLMAQAQEVQRVSNQRLMSLRLLEGFTNNIIQLTEQLRRDMNELNLVSQQSAETESDGGEN